MLWCQVTLTDLFRAEVHPPTKKIVIIFCQVERKQFQISKSLQLTAIGKAGIGFLYNDIKIIPNLSKT